MFAPKRISEDESKASPETVDIVFKNFSVDDCLKAVATEKKAIAIVKDSTTFCTTGGLYCPKWASNSRKLFASIYEKERA